jgi:hypothetical protein
VEYNHPGAEDALTWAECGYTVLLRGGKFYLGIDPEVEEELDIQLDNKLDELWSD